MSDERSNVRRLFMILSPSSLPYARLALRSLYCNADENFHLSLITDSDDDARQLSGELEQLKTLQAPAERFSSVYSAHALNDREQEKFGKYPHIRGFRSGHPCWRKITDPILLTEERDEIVVLDPDLYFPNRFAFEPTPDSGVYLMWQKPSCLLPPEVVDIAMQAKIPLAHHTDIGVAQWRLPIDLDWLDWLIGKLGSSQLPRSMHVESIVWAALAMRLGGGYLDRAHWVCWHRTQYKRLLLKLGTKGSRILDFEGFSKMKCFHAGGEAKWWLADARNLAPARSSGESVISLAGFSPFVELKTSEYYSLQRTKRWLRKLGYYSFLGEG
jgi:hypothetical protein